MNNQHKEITAEIHTLFNQTEWGSMTEQKSLLDMGRLLALPIAKPTHRFLPFLSTYEQLSVELAAGILCAFVYKNPKQFILKNLRQDIPAALLDFMVKAKVIKSYGTKYKVTNYAKFGKWLESIVYHKIPDTYTIRSATKRYEIKYDYLVASYLNSTPKLYTVGHDHDHPFSFYILGFINRSDCSNIDAVLAIKNMLDSLTFLTTGKFPKTTEVELGNDVKRAWLERCEYLTNLYASRKTK